MSRNPIVIDPELRQFIFDKIDYKPHSEKQKGIHESTSRFKVLCCGRRYGKTTMGGEELTVAMCDVNQIGHYWIVGPTYPGGEKEFRVVHDNLIRKLGFGNKIKKQYNVLQGNMRIEMPWGTVLEVKSAERQEGLLGEGLLGVVMAEAARHSAATWEQYIRPALSDHRGWAIFPSTPRGYNWFQGLWLLGKVEPDYESWRLPSWENPVAYPGGRDDPEIKELERNTSHQFFEQEIAAEFTAFAGKIYDEFDPAIHVVRKEYDPRQANYWWFDYGWDNPFVCLDAMVDASDNVHIWREYMVSHKSTYDHGHILINRDNPPGFHVDARYGDPRGAGDAATLGLVIGQIFSEDIEREIGYEIVRRWLKLHDGQPKLTIDPSCVNLIRQMEQLHNVEVKDGVNARDIQHKHDDHGPDALRYGMGQLFHLGLGSSLSDVYTPGQGQTEAATFFQHNTSIGRYGRF